MGKERLWDSKTWIMEWVQVKSCSFSKVSTVASSSTHFNPVLGSSTAELKSIS